MSTPVPLVIVGGGEHAGVVADAARSRPEAYRLVGYVDRVDDPSAGARLGLPLLGDDAWLASHGECVAVLGIGSTRDTMRRQAVAARIGLPPERWATVVHARAVVSPAASLAPGAVVMANAVVNPGARLGAHVVVNTGAIVEHDVSLAAHVMIGPGTVLGGCVEIGEGTFVGLGARIRDHVRIGAGVLVAMGAVVTRAVEDRQVVGGVPARILQS